MNYIHSRVVDEIIRLTRCQPFLVQLMCYAMVEYLNNTKRNEAVLKDIEAITPKVFEMAMGYFNEFWRLSLNADERDLLSGMLKGRNIIEHPPGVVKRLIRKEVLERVNGGLQFQVPLIEKYIKERLNDE